MCHKMCHKILATVIILIALGLAFLISVWHDQGMSYIIFISRFFDVMLPVLAVGALIKYLLWHGSHSCCCNTSEGCCKKGQNPEVPPTTQQ
jgi:hypothetical protein